MSEIDLRGCRECLLAALSNNSSSRKPRSGYPGPSRSSLDAGRALTAAKQRGCKTLVWFEGHLTMGRAIAREKQIKRWRRDWKLALIEADNRDWRDLSDGWFDASQGALSWMQQP